MSKYSYKGRDRETLKFSAENIISSSDWSTHPNPHTQRMESIKFVQLVTHDELTAYSELYS